jgi:NADH-quinone oxidoreductase subunit G
MPKIVIDGSEFEFNPGQTVIQVAAENGIDIPHFCWHPCLSVSGNCRMCLVEIEKMPKLAISCSTLAADGMVVYTKSEKTIKARNAVMEFFLINHPLDCPICDEAGECKLQDYAYSHSVGESRFTEVKNNKKKRVPLGPYVMFDGERCISCSRCIRFCDEIAGERQLTFVQRGDRVTITTYPGKSLDNPYSLNVTDICPVGALTNRDFRFKSRVWEMSSTKSICSGCSRGCNIDIWVRNNEALRLTPRFNNEVNSYWMCDNGRLNTFKFVNSEDRVEGPFLRREGNLIKTGWDEAIAFAVSELKSFGKDEIAFIGSAFATNEDNYIFARFAKSIIGSRHVDFMPHIKRGESDKLLITEDKSPNSLGAFLVGIQPGKGGLGFDGIIQAIKEGKIKAVYMLEDDIISARPELEPVFAKLDLLIVHATNFNKTTALAELVLPASSYAEKHGSFVNFEGRVQRIRTAVATQDFDRALDGLAQSRLDRFGTRFDKWANAKKRDSRSSWRIIAAMAGALGHKIKYSMSEEVFAEIAANIPEFDGMNYDVIGETGTIIRKKTVDSKNVKV